MTTTPDRTRDILMAYGRALNDGRGLADLFGDDIIFTLMNTGEQVRGAESVARRVHADTRLSRERNPRSLIVGEGQAAAEIDWIGQDGTITPHVAAFALSGEKITAIRLYYAGSVPG